MALEAGHIAEAVEMAPENRQAKSERRGKDRRRGKTRINKAAPRRSLMKLCAGWASGMSLGIFGVAFLATTLVLEETPWIALFATATAVVTSLFALMLGCIEQRLIEIRLELMMANGGMRQADRRNGERRADARPDADPLAGELASPPASGPGFRVEGAGPRPIVQM